MIQPSVSPAQPLCNRYSKLQPLRKKNIITINGGGSAAGLNAVATDKVTIGAADMFAENSDAPAAKLVDHQIAVVGITPIVNPEVGVSNLTSAQLKAIFFPES